MTVKLQQVGVAEGIVEAVSIPLSIETGEYKPWSMDIHNAGESGIFGGGIVNYSGPGNIVVEWQGEETVMPPSPTGAFIIHYADPQPNCTHLITDGRIKFMAEGTYVIQVHGVHQEGTDWFSDDYKEFSVVVSGAVEEYCSLSGVVTGFFGMVVGGAVVELNGEERETNTAGEYSFVSVLLGSYTLKVTPGGFFYESYEKKLSLTVVDKAYKENVGLSLKSLIKYGVPLTAIACIGGVVYVKRVRVPTVPEVYKTPTGYRLVRE
ncbi:carboxypeptidase-like regulatory domain-containing protein [Patescibacteria group bacterium]|nr:carboxypeptidase-like regulatory domain-containing protein [Patescibacteria group bacterium]